MNDLDLGQAVVHLISKIEQLYLVDSYKYKVPKK